MKKSKVFITVIAMVVLLLFFFTQGAIVMMTNMEGLKSILVRATVIWLLVIATIVFYLKRNRDLSILGFCKPMAKSSKRVFFYIPLIVIAISHFMCGIDTNKGASFIFANLIFTLAIGFAEEIYFRGIICRIWIDESVKKAVVVSSTLFAICHLMNVMGGAGITETILQICFAFLYGIVISFVFIIGKSIWSCIAVHTLHDFCSFISIDGSSQMNVILGVIQFVILLCYAIYLSKQLPYDNQDV
ncbi:MAG: CPBP family intramembrane metalloprotease [Ruminococcus sp.]|nr:CPBP family intramembrane metalloprotease [Ruminococcus sp.]